MTADLEADAGALAVGTHGRILLQDFEMDGLSRREAVE